jgi:hypothetical protein
MKSTMTIEKSIITIGRKKVTVYQNIKTAAIIASQYQYLLRSFSGPFNDHQLQRPTEVEADSITAMSLIDACERGILVGRIPANLLKGFVVIIDFLEFRNETEGDYRHKLCLDFFIQERCHKRLYPIFMRKREAFIQWSKYQFGSILELPIQRREIHIMDSITLSIDELATYHPNLMRTLDVKSRRGYTNVISYKYTDEKDPVVYVELLPLFLESIFSERFCYF